MTLDDIVVDNLPDIHLGFDKLEVKLLFDPKKFKNCHNIDVRLVDSIGYLVPIEVYRWGTKMRVTASFSSRIAEGKITVVAEDDASCIEVVKFWFVR